MSENHSSDSQTTKSMSFRIPSDIAEMLETSAQINKTNISTVLIQMLRNQIEYEGIAGKAGLVAFPKSLLTQLMSGYSNDQIITIANIISKDVTTDMMMILQNEFTIESFLETIKSWARASAIPHMHEVNGEIDTVVIQHNMTKNWSMYLGHLYKNIIEELTQKKVSIEATDHSIRIRF